MTVAHVSCSIFRAICAAGIVQEAFKAFGAFGALEALGALVILVALVTDRASAASVSVFSPGWHSRAFFVACSALVSFFYSWAA